VAVFDDLAELEMLSGRIDDALAWSDRALELVRAEKSEETEVVFLMSRAEMLVTAGRFAAAEKVFAQALALAEANEYFYLQVSIYLRRANMNRTRGRYGAAAADMEKSLEALGSANEPLREPAIWGNLAMNYILLGADDSARMALERARQLAEKNARCLDVAIIDLIESCRKFVNDELSFSDFSKAFDHWIRTPDALSVPGMEDVTQLLTTLLSSDPSDPQLPFRSGILSPGTAELLQAAALFSQDHDPAAARRLAMKGLKLNPNPKHRAGARSWVSFNGTCNIDRMTAPGRDVRLIT
jgi:tetratricopeptide (TPR) repeat protein